MLYTPTISLTTQMPDDYSISSMSHRVVTMSVDANEPRISQELYWEVPCIGITHTGVPPSCWNYILAENGAEQCLLG